MIPLLLSLLLAPGPAPHPGAHPAPPASALVAVRGAPDDRVDVLVERIEGLSGWQKARAIEELARLATRDAYEAHARITDDLRNDEVRERAMRAFASYRGAEGVEGRAIAYLDERSGAGKAPVRRAAIQGLALFEGAAESELRRHLRRSKDAEVRARAVAGLRELLATGGAASDLELLVENAVPGRSGTAVELREALDRFTGEASEEVLAAALRRGRGHLELRVLLCESLGPREGETAGEGLVAALRDPSWEVRLTALRSLEARRDPELAGRLQKLLADPAEVVRREAVIQLARLETDRGAAERRLVQLAGDRDAGVRQGAAVALAALRTPAALRALETLLADEDHLVRREALHQLGGLRRKETIPLLLEHLPAARGRHRFDVLRVLRLLTGEDHGTSPQRWGRWWEAEGASFVLPPYEEALAAERERAGRREAGGTTSTFYGLQVVSERVVFVLDVSGSMSALSGGQRRIDAARDQLLDALEAFPAGGLFNLIFFSTGADAWGDEVVEMDRRSREEALEYVLRQKPGGGTAVHTALELAFQDRDVDTIYLLTDGVPSAGRVTDPDQIRAEVRRWNEHRGVVIHGIAVGMESPLLRGLAEDTGGDYTFVR